MTSRRLRFVTLAGAFLGGAMFVMAQPGTGRIATVPFQLDGDATASGGGNDWQNSAGGSVAYTGIVSDPSNFSGGQTVTDPTTFVQGSKDTLDISGWNWAAGGIPPKDDIVNAYAAAYLVGPVATEKHLIVVFGADRFANNGSAQLGFWLLQGKTTQVSGKTGTFTGTHAVGDILALVNFTQGGGVPDIAVYEWTGGKQNPLTLINANVGQCGNAAATDACAITNTSSPVDLFWPSTFKFPSATPCPGVTGALSCAPLVSFFEGALDVTALLGGVTPCLSSFMAETRSSTSLTASTEDFVLHQFSLCGLTVSKACSTSASPVSPAVKFINGTPYIHYDFTGQLTNDGVGTIFDPTVTDSFPATAINLKLIGPASGTTNTGGCPGTGTTCDPLKIVLTNGLLQGTSVTYTGGFDFPTEGTITNNVTATAAGTAGGDQTVTTDINGNPTAGSANFGDQQTTCHITTNPTLTLTKFCNILLAPTSSGVVLELVDEIKVCNESSDGLTQITNININNTVVNGPSTPTTVDTNLTLDAGKCKVYTPPVAGTYPPSPYPPAVGSFLTYTPTNCTNNKTNPTLDAAGLTTASPDPGRCTFQDTAAITSPPKDEFGTSLSSSQYTASFTAQCRLCLFGYCSSDPGGNPPGPSH